MLNAHYITIYDITNNLLHQTIKFYIFYNLNHIYKLCDTFTYHLSQLYPVAQSAIFQQGFKVGVSTALGVPSNAVAITGMLVRINGQFHSLSTLLLSSSSTYLITSLLLTLSPLFYLPYHLSSTYPITSLLLTLPLSLTVLSRLPHLTLSIR